MPVCWWFGRPVRRRRGGPAWCAGRPADRHAGSMSGRQAGFVSTVLSAWPQRGVAAERQDGCMAGRPAGGTSSRPRGREVFDDVFRGKSAGRFGLVCRRAGVPAGRPVCLPARPVSLPRTVSHDRPRQWESRGVWGTGRRATCPEERPISCRPARRRRAGSRPRPSGSTRRRSSARSAGRSPCCSCAGSPVRSR